MEILGGPLFAAAGAGESHGLVATIIFGCPAGHYLKREEINPFLTEDGLEVTAMAPTQRR